LVVVTNKSKLSPAEKNARRFPEQRKAGFLGVICGDRSLNSTRSGNESVSRKYPAGVHGPMDGRSDNVAEMPLTDDPKSEHGIAFVTWSTFAKFASARRVDCCNAAADCLSHSRAGGNAEMSLLISRSVDISLRAEYYGLTFDFARLIAPQRSTNASYGRLDQRERAKNVHGSISRSIGPSQFGVLRAYDLLELLSGEDT